MILQLLSNSFSTSPLFVSGSLLSIFLVVISSFFVLIRKPNLVGILYFLIGLCVVIFQAHYLIGIGISDPDIARNIFMFNLVDFWISLFFIHWCLSLNRNKGSWWHPMVILYPVGVFLFIVSLIYDEQFIPNVKPKLDFLNYPNPGVLYFGMVAFFGLCFFYGLYILVHNYRDSDEKNKNRFKFAISGSLLGYFFGSISFLLVWDIQVFPILSSLLGLYSVPVAYAIAKHNLMDIRIVIKRTFLYALAVFILGFAVYLITVANSLFLVKVRWAEAWMVPFIISTTSVLIAYIIWKRLDNLERAKYEFLAIAAHKIRTPLTRTKHGIEVLRENIEASMIEQRAHELTDIDMRLLNRIEKDNRELIELTSIMLQGENLAKNGILLQKELVDIRNIFSLVINSNKYNLYSKDIAVDLSMDKNIPLVQADPRRIKSVVEILFDNAVIYSKSADKILIKLSLTDNGKRIQAEFMDKGIGIEPSEIDRVFESFYRTSSARKHHTEGTGLGLFMAETIIKAHGGVIWADSEGLDKGTKIIFTIPITT